MQETTGLERYSISTEWIFTRPPQIRTGRCSSYALLKALLECLLPM
jgi:hypothetical protein